MEMKESYRRYTVPQDFNDFVLDVTRLRLVSSYEVLSNRVAADANLQRELDCALALQPVYSNARPSLRG
jgi:hypothetical protein